jgi:hypothetical protein
MRRTIYALLATLLLAAPAWATAVQPQPHQARNVRLEAQVVGDSAVTLTLRWNAPQGGPRIAPVTGWEWEVGKSEDQGLALGGFRDSTLAVGVVAADVRVVSVTVPVDCASPHVYHGGRVRAVTDMAEDAPWGVSGVVEIRVPCVVELPGPPEVFVDTLAVDTLDTEPDQVSMTWMPTDPSLAITSGEPGVWAPTASMRAWAHDTTMRACAFTVRGSSYFRLPAGTGAYIDGTGFVADPVVGAGACWDILVTGTEEANLWFVPPVWNGA